MELNPEALMKIRLYTSEEGGRNGPIFSKYYSCPLLLDVNDNLYDCRIILNGITMNLGEEYVVPVKFLDFENAKRKIIIGKEILIWEGRWIGRGEIIKLYPDCPGL